MYTLNPALNDFETLRKQQAKLVEQIFSQIPAVARAETLAANRRFYEDPGDAAKLFILREGNVRFEREGRLLYFLEAGDLLGVERCWSCAACKIWSDFAVVVDVYSWKDVCAKISCDVELLESWSRYLSTLASLNGSLLCAALKEEREIIPAVRKIEPGNMIIEEGTLGDEVFTLLSGSADVFVGNTKVGEVHGDEIFGALAAITGTPRTATVKANATCTVLALPKHQFQELMETRPQTVMSLFESMARIIVSLNREVVSLSKGHL